MWFAILTPGAHPSRETPTDEATVMCWSREERARVDGPFWALAGGLRELRRWFAADARPSMPPRCFVCREPCAVPGRARLAALRARPQTPIPPLPTSILEEAEKPFLAFVHLADLRHPGEDRSLEETAVIVVPGDPFVITTTLECVPDAMAGLAVVGSDFLDPTCPGCGNWLPGSARQRDVEESRAA